MKKTAIFTALCAVILILLVSCGKESSSRRFVNNYPLEIHAYIEFDGRSYEADLMISSENDIRISFTAPETLHNTVLEMKNGESFLLVSGITLLINDGGYSSENGLLLIRHLFSLSAKSYRDAEVVKTSGKSYCVENYVTQIGTVSAYFIKDKPLPDKITATLRGHNIELIIVNE